VTEKGTRARDDDRTTAIQVIEDAFADGQITREEYDVRLDKALRATRLRELDALLADLQDPGGKRWQPRLLTRRSTPVAPASIATASPAKKPGAAILVPLVAVLVLVIVLAPRLFDDHSLPAGPSLTDTADRSVQPLTETGYREFLTALKAREGDLVVFSVRVHKEGVDVDVPVDVTTRHYQSLTWDGQWQDRDSTGTSETARFDLGRIDPALIARASQTAAGLVEEPDTFQVTVTAPSVDDAACVSSYASNRYDDSAGASFDCAGIKLEQHGPSS